MFRINKLPKMTILSNYYILRQSLIDQKVMFRRNHTNINYCYNLQNKQIIKRVFSSFNQINDNIGKNDKNDNLMDRDRSVIITPEESRQYMKSEGIYRSII